MNTARKALVAGLTLLAAWIPTATADGSVSVEEWGQLAGIPVAAFLVWLVPNRSDR